MEYKKNTIIIEYTKTPSYVRRQQLGISSVPTTLSAPTADRFAKAIAAVRLETALREIRRSEATLASQRSGTAEKEGGRRWDQEKHDEGNEK